MKKIIALLLALITMFSLVGCSNNDSNGDGEPQKEQGGRLVCGFSCVDEVRMFEYLSFYNAKVEINDDKDFVTEGDASAKFTFDGIASYRPQVNIWSDSKFFGDKDFTKVQALTLDVFNPTEKPFKMFMSFTTSVAGDRKEFKKYSEKEFEVKPGKNLISFTIDRTVAASVCDMKNVEYVSLKFVEIGEKFSFYVDNLRAYETDEEVTPMVKEYKENEILLFDDAADRFFVDTVSWMCSAATLPTMSICRDPDYIKEGSGSLMILYSESAGWGAGETPCFFISGEPMTRIDFSKYSKITLYVFSNCGTSINIRFWDVNGTMFMYSPWEEMGYPYVTEDKTAYYIEMDIQKIADNGLDVSQLTRMEFFYGQKVGVGNALFIDDVKVVK